MHRPLLSLGSHHILFLCSTTLIDFRLLINLTARENRFHKRCDDEYCALLNLLSHFLVPLSSWGFSVVSSLSLLPLRTTHDSMRHSKRLLATWCRASSSIAHFLWQNAQETVVRIITTVGPCGCYNALRHQTHLCHRSRDWISWWLLRQRLLLLRKPKRRPEMLSYRLQLLQRFTV